MVKVAPYLVLVFWRITDARAAPIEAAKEANIFVDYSNAST